MVRMMIIHAAEGRPCTRNLHFASGLGRLGRVRMMMIRDSMPVMLRLSFSSLGVLFSIISIATADSHDLMTAC